MAINIPADKQTERALTWLAKRFKLSKAELVRSLIREKYQATQGAFALGAFAGSLTLKEQPSDIQRELEELDVDRDLD